MEELIFIQVVPHNIRFLWEIEVQIHNFREFGISNQMQVLVWYPNLELNAKIGRRPEPVLVPLWVELQKKYPEVQFYFYEDEGVNLELYIPQLRPHTLKKHFRIYPELSSKVFFYHDSDIIFRELPDFEALMSNEINWQSDTSGYLDYNYLKTKETQAKCGEGELINLLCSIGDITEDTLKSYTKKTGGAQYLLKQIDSDFWEDVEKMCINIRKHCTFGIKDSFNSKYFNSENEGLQSWCADMWAVNFSLWKRNKVTDITPELGFSWATGGKKEYEKHKIFHNAGVTSQSTGLFNKGKYLDRSPLGKKQPLPSSDSAQYAYVQLINSIS